MTNKLKTILSIAASDPLGGAGIQQDLRVGNALGLHVLTAITGITVQNSRGFYNLVSVTYKLLSEQLRAILEDVTPDAIKIGMTGSVECIDVISDFIKKIPEVPVIIDPVLNPTVTNFSSNNNFDDLIIGYKEKLFPFTKILTPNLKEFKIIFGTEFQDNINSLRNCLTTNNLGYMVIKGGDISDNIITDYLVSTNKIISFEHPKISCRNLHGTGCALSTILASRIAVGDTIEDAFFYSEKKMKAIIEKSCDYKLGNSSYGPLNINDYKFFKN